jgi:hypothetical protein
VLDAASFVRPYPGLPRGGDLGVIRELKEGALVALVDGLGHGLTAHAAAQAAHRALLATHSEEPAAVLLDLHEALKGTVGAAAAVARVYRGRFVFAGIGNVAGWYAGRRLLSRDGVLGQHFRPPRVTEQVLSCSEWLLLHTDGVSYAGAALPSGMAATVVRALVDSAGKMHDDAAVLAVRWVEGVP